LYVFLKLLPISALRFYVLTVKAKPILPQATYFLIYTQTEPNCSENPKNHQR